jgi:UDP-N-acetyl-D-mannosaminuronic acid dehydrogenase
VSLADAFIIAVPTPSDVDHRPDLSHVQQAAASIVPFLRKGNLVILESTSPPGTTLGMIPILEQSGLVVGQDIHLAHSPERVLPGRILTELVENDRVVGGHTSNAAEACADLYRTFVRSSIHLTDATTAEMTKLMENTFRDVNIALANEFSRIGAHVGIDIHEAIALANRHPRVNILSPGPGVGGHCIAVDPWFIVDAAPEQANLIRVAREVNDAQPGHVVELILDGVSEVRHPEVAILGLAYKANVDDMRESPALDVVRQLDARGISLRLHDAHVTRPPVGVPLERDLATTVAGADVIVILTDHQEYRLLDPRDPVFAGMRSRTVIDTRHCLDVYAWQAAGFTVRQLGVAVQPGVVAGIAP